MTQESRNIIKEGIALAREQGLELNDGAVITSPGKFEGESVATLYFYDLLMNGEGEQIGRSTWSFPISPAEAAFPLNSFPERTAYIIFISEQGFVCGKCTEPVQVTTYTLPVGWASYLINGDDSGLGEGEQEQIDNWLKSEGSPNFVDIGEESWFDYRNDAGEIGGDVCTYFALER